MFDMSPIVRSYEELLVLSEQMLEAARASNWDALNDLQQVYMAEVDRLRLLDHTKPFSDNERLRRFQLLERILAYDARIRDLTMPRLAQLGELLNSSRRKLELSAAYGATA
jgi:flagellar protein FliT